MSKMKQPKFWYLEAAYGEDWREQCKSWDYVTDRDLLAFQRRLIEEDRAAEKRRNEEHLYRLVDSLNEEQKLDLIRVLAWAWRDALNVPLENLVLSELRKKAEA